MNIKRIDGEENGFQIEVQKKEYHGGRQHIVSKIKIDDGYIKGKVDYGKGLYLRKRNEEFVFLKDQISKTHYENQFLIGKDKMFMGIFSFLVLMVGFFILVISGYPFLQIGESSIYLLPVIFLLFGFIYWASRIKVLVLTLKSNKVIYIPICLRFEKLEETNALYRIFIKHFED